MPSMPEPGSGSLVSDSHVPHRQASRSQWGRWPRCQFCLAGWEAAVGLPESESKSIRQSCYLSGRGAIVQLQRSWLTVLTYLAIRHRHITRYVDSRELHRGTYQRISSGECGYVLHALRMFGKDGRIIFLGAVTITLHGSLFVSTA
jgi:hypothetical protein